MAADVAAWLRRQPRRRSFGAPAFVVVFGLSVWAVIARGLFDGMTLLVGATALVLALLQLLPNRPKLRVAPKNGPSMRGRSVSIFRLDKDAIVSRSAEEVRSRMPKRPKRTPDDGLSAIYGIGALEDTIRSIHRLSGGGEPTEDDFRRNEQEYKEYVDELRLWLDRLEYAQYAGVRGFEGELRLEELGQAPADHVHLRLLFPEGFELEGDVPAIGDPPPPPIFSRIPMPRAATFPSSLFRQPARLPDIRLPGSANATYSVVDGKVRIDYQLGHVNQSDSLDVSAFELWAPREGSYTIKWEITATGLSKPATGIFEIVIPELDRGGSIGTEADAKGEQERLESV
jgi:hypothetical protein